MEQGVIDDQAPRQCAGATKQWHHMHTCCYYMLAPEQPLLGPHAA